MIDDESSEEGVEVVEAMVEVVEKEVCPQLDPSILGVPGLKTLVPGDRVEVLWTHGVPCLYSHQHHTYSPCHMPPTQHATYIAMPTNRAYSAMCLSQLHRA